jgi:transcriptional regulator with AAA-type ATPase domain
VEPFFNLPGVSFPTGHQAKHAFACYYQIVRAFHHIFAQIIGNSRPAARLRAAIWQSIFTHDIRRYRRTLFSRMSEFATLITGPSGTGKELVARSIALSRYVPFHEDRLNFQEDLTSLFFPINIAALPGTLVESELFGHKRGSFTGAVEDKRGWLEACPPLGAVFLDEIGDLEPEIQVKLLRVIETRTFQALGESHAQSRRFQGKLLAATNRNLGLAIRKGRFREDLYYRLCSDQPIITIGRRSGQSRHVRRSTIRRFDGQRADQPLLHSGLFADWQLRRDRQTLAARPAHGKGKSKLGASCGPPGY